MLRLVAVALTLIILSGCGERLTEEERAKIYEERGFNEMKMKKKRLKPEIIEFGKPFYELAEVSIENAVATIDGSGSFALIYLDERGKIELEPIVEGFPGGPGILGSDSEHNVLWITRGRGLYILDIESKKTGHTIVTNDGNAKIIQVFLIDREELIFGIVTISAGAYPAYSIYYLLEDRLELVSSCGTLFPFYNNKLLGFYFDEEVEPPMREWDISDYRMDNFVGAKGNKLTRELSKLQIDTWHKTKTIHLGKRMMLGTGWIGDKLLYYSVRWNEEIDEVKIEPLLLQLPKDSLVHDDFTFSADGNWVQTLYTQQDSYPQMVELIIYHAAAIYPQGLSTPIYCGYTKDGNEGAFMQHSEWGPLFVERDQDMRDKLFIYRLNDGLEILKEQATGLIEGEE